MHERGTVMCAIHTINDVCADNNLTKVESVTLQVGEVSGILPEYIEKFWKYAIQKEKYLRESKLIIEPIKAYTRCGNCNRLYETVKFAKICPYCKSMDTWLETGNEYIIKEICAE